MDWEAMRKQEAGGTPLCRDRVGSVEADLLLLALRAAGRCSGGWGCVVGDDLQWLQKCHGVRTARGSHRRGAVTPSLLHRLGRAALHCRGWDLITQRGRSERCKTKAGPGGQSQQVGVGVGRNQGMGSECSLKSPGTPQASAGGLSAAPDIRAHGATLGTWNQTGPSLNPAPQLPVGNPVGDISG